MSAIASRVLRVVLVGMLAGCGKRVPPFVEMRLPSGRVVKVQSWLPEHLFNGEEALLLKFVPDAPIDDVAALDAEVASLWKEVQQDAVKRPGTKLVLLRVVPGEPDGWRDARCQYVYRLQPDGTWSMQKDPEVRLR